jgi:hypothetical protein
LQAACEVLVHLNRRAKDWTLKWYNRCDDDDDDDCAREKIYSVKRQLIHLLRTHNYLVEAHCHIQQLPASECWGCHGTGVWTGTYEQATCHRCEGTGLYREARTERLALLTFEIHGQRYSWHSPEEEISPPVDYATESEWQPRAAHRSWLRMDEVSRAISLLSQFVASPCGPHPELIELAGELRACSLLERLRALKVDIPGGLRRRWRNAQARARRAGCALRLSSEF